MVFTPAKGPGATASIKQGRYETRPDWGTVGGLHSIEIVATELAGDAEDAEQPNEGPGPLFQTVIQRKIPQQAGTLDIHLTEEDVERP